MKKLIIFVDALPFKKLNLMPNIAKELNISKIEPSYGYSVNLHYLMFEGKYPDDVSFFGEYKFNVHKNRDKLRILSLPDLFFEKLEMNFCRKAYRKFILKINDMIPYKRRAYFEKKGTYFFKELVDKEEYLGEKYNVYLEELDKELPKSIKKRMPKIEQKIKCKIEEEQNLFLSFYTLDYYGHCYGTEKEEYEEILKEYDSMLASIIKYAKNKEYQKILMVSDHGMSTNREHIDIREFEKRFSKYFGKHIVYFYDSLYFQAKALDEKGRELLREIESYFKGIPGEIISEQQRVINGLSSKEFGDFMFVLNDELAFSPNYFGYVKMKGYHGYTPGLTNQLGVLGVTGKTQLNEKYSSKEFNEFLTEYLKG